MPRHHGALAHPHFTDGDARFREVKPPTQGHTLGRIQTEVGLKLQPAGSSPEGVDQACHLFLHGQGVKKICRGMGKLCGRQYP